MSIGINQEIKFNTPANFIFDPEKIEFVDNKAQLKMIDNPLTFSNTMGSLLGVTYDATKVDYVNGAFSQSSQAEEYAIAAAKYDDSINLTWNTGGTKTGLPIGNPVNMNGKLVCPDGVNGVVYTDASLGSMGNKGAIRVKYTPNYENSPSVINSIFSLTNDGNPLDKISLIHHTDGNLKLTAYNNTGINIYLDETIGLFEPQSGQEYILELVWDFTVNGFDLYIDGTQLGTSLATTSQSRGLTATTLTLGSFTQEGAFADTKSIGSTNGETRVYFSLFNPIAANTLPNRSEFTLSCWLKPGASQPANAVIAMLPGATANIGKFDVTMSTDMKLTTTVRPTLTDETDCLRVATSTPALTPNVWNNLVISVNLPTKEIKVIVNGVELQLDAPLINTMTSTTWDTAINNFNLHVLFDNVYAIHNEISMWGRAFDATEVNTHLYNSGVPTDLKSLPVSSDLIHWWRGGEFTVAGGLYQPPTMALNQVSGGTAAGYDANPLVGNDVPAPSAPLPKYNANASFDDLVILSQPIQNEAYTIANFLYSASTVTFPAVLYFGIGTIQEIGEPVKTGTNPPAHTTLLSENARTFTYTLEFSESNTQEDITTIQIPYVGQIYPTDNPTINFGNPLYMTDLQEIETVEQKQFNDELKYSIKYKDTYYNIVNGAIGPSNGTYTQANTMAEIMAALQFGSIDIEPDSPVTIVTYLHSGNGSSTPAIESIKLGYDYFLPQSKIETCVVAGRITDQAGEPVAGAKVRFDSKKDYFYNDNLVARVSEFETDTEGMFYARLAETESTGVTMTCTITYYEKNRQVKTVFKNLVIPNAVHQNLNDIVQTSLES